MSIRYVQGDILESTADLIVIPVNCVGVMGAGLAKQYAKVYAAKLPSYKEACHAGALEPGRLYPAGGRFFYATTKDHWKQPSLDHWIISCLADISATALLLSAAKVAIPALGCGCGGVDWKTFKRMAETHLHPLRGPSFDVTIYEPL